MATYTYHQNNSFGVFDGPYTITVTADSDEEADALAEAEGAYFDGCDKGLDCYCCGDRWYRAYGPDAEDSE